MNKFRTVAAVIIMVLASIAGFFVGTALGDGLIGSVLFAVILGFACVIYVLDNKA